MYFYIFDEFAKEKQYQKKLNRISLRLNDLGIFDDKARVTTVKSIESIVSDVLSINKFKHVIAVGDDNTASLAINALMKNKTVFQKPAFGIIPLRASKIADCLGMPENIDKSCTLISRRKLENLDIAQADNKYFISSLDIIRENIFPQKGLEKLKSIFLKKSTDKYPEVEIKIRNFKLLTQAQIISVVNILDSAWFKKLSGRKGLNIKKINPQDGMLNLLIATNPDNDDQNLSEISYFISDNISISSKIKTNWLADNTQIMKSPIKIKILPQKLSALVGKERKF